MLDQLEDYFRQGGLFMYLNLWVAGGMLAVVLDRAWILGRRQPPSTEHLFVQIDLLITPYADAARHALELSSQSAVTRLVLTVLERSPVEPAVALRTLHAEALALRQGLWRRLEALPSLILVATLVSLMGSIVGMLPSHPAFIGLATPEQKTALLTRGLSESMYNTVFGLLLALLGQVAYSVLRDRVAAQDAAFVRVARRIQEVLETLSDCTEEGPPAASRMHSRANPGSLLIGNAHRRRARHQLELARSRSLWSLQALMVFLTLIPAWLLAQAGTQSSFYLTDAFRLPVSSSTIGNMEPAALVLVNQQGVWVADRKLLFLPPPDPDALYGPCGPRPCQIDRQAYAALVEGFRLQLERVRTAIAARRPLEPVVPAVGHKVIRGFLSSRRPTRIDWEWVNEDPDEPVVMVMADRRVEYWLLEAILKAAREAGFRSFRFQVFAA